MNLIFTEQIDTEQELVFLTKKVLSSVGRNSIIILSGSLSAGKTTFVSYFCKLFDIQFSQSPTYALHQRYSNKDIVIDHFDLYRLETEDDIQSSGFYDLLAAPADYKFIEWPERVSGDDFPLGQRQYKIEIKITDVGCRQFDFYEITPE